MHPSLDLQNLDRITNVRIRRCAVAAAKGDVEQLGTLSDNITQIPHPELLLPVYYHALDDAAITALVARLHAGSGTDEDGDGSFDAFFDIKYGQMSYSLLALLNTDSQGDLPLAPLPDFWSRVWPWINFIETYRECLPLESEDLSSLDQVFLRCILLLKRHDTAAKLIEATPRFRLYIFRLWDRYLNGATIASRTFFSEFCAYIQDGPTLSTDRDFEEALEGSGGTRTSLAALVVKHVNRILDSKENSKSLLFIIPFIHSKSESDAAFTAALVDAGVVQCLTSAALTFTRRPFSDHADLFSTCADALLHFLGTTSRHDLFVQCLRAGSFRIFFTLARSPRLPERLRAGFLRGFLSRLAFHLVYLSVLSHLEASITELKIPFGADSFQESLIADQWPLFWAVLERRRAVAKFYSSSENPHRMACDNLACGAILSKSNFQRCSGCSTLNYCSRACQLWDWRHGGHPNSCKTLLTLRRAEPARVSARDRSFFRALLDDDYRRMKAEILTAEVEFLRSNPDAESYVLFDYALDPYVPCRASVKPMAELNPRLADYAFRVARSGGRMRLHLMQVADGESKEFWMYPLRMTSNRLMAEVQLIALSADLPDGEAAGEDVHARIHRLVELDDVAIHT